MLDNAKPNLSNARLLQARECLESAEREFAANSFKSAANRSYYCVFHAMRAVLALDSFDSKKHSGVISQFRLKYIKAGIFPAELSSVIRSAFEIRNDSDYQDFYVISRDDVAVQIANAKTFLAAVEGYINTSLNRTQP
jgi:hypothetical protein